VIEQLKTVTNGHFKADSKTEVLSDKITGAPPEKEVAPHIRRNLNEIGEPPCLGLRRDKCTPGLTSK
jgi:hypothetical protein